MLKIKNIKNTGSAISAGTWFKTGWLVVWNMTYDFPYFGNVIIPTDELIFFRGVGTTNQV